MNKQRDMAHTVSMRRYSLMLLLFVASIPTSALALGFGSLVMSSHLNQKLSANVPIILGESDDIDAVHVALASKKEYQQLGLQWQTNLTRIKVFLQAKHSDQPYIALRSVGSIHTPILSILLKADKAGRGTYYKYFQLLLDPVEIKALRQQQPTVIPLRSALDKAVAEPVPSDAGWARIWRYGPVQAGDSLSEIAYRLRRDKRYSNRQVMMSLYEENPNGFVNGDINLLKRGAWLSVPHGDVVKQYAGKSSMQKLSQLLAHRRPVSHALQPSQQEPKRAAPQAKAKPSAHQTVEQAHQELRYSGNISVNGATADKLAHELKTVKNGFDQQFEAIHTEMMAGKLQMASLDKTVSSLNQSVQGIKQDIHALKQDVAIIKSRTEQPLSESFSNWQLALFALLAAIFGALVAIIFRTKTAETTEQISSHPPLAKDTDSTDKTEPPLIADEAIQLLNRAEESLCKCEYEQAEKTLRQIDKLTPDSVRASALKAQLFHETDRHGERNNLINSISEASDKYRWERFCQLLPSHVWNACFGGQTSDSQAQNDESQS